MATTPLDLSLIGAYTGGVNMPRESEALYLARVNAAGNNLEYLPAADAVTADGALAAALAPLLRGGGLTVDASNKLALRPRPRHLQVQDHFIDTNTTGTIGQLGWSLLGGATITRAVNGNLTQNTRLRLVSPTAGIGGLTLGNGNSFGIASNAQLGNIQAGIATPNISVPPTWSVGFGWSDSRNVVFPSAEDCAAIYATNTTPNWQAIVRQGSSGSPVDTGVLVSTALSLVTIQRAGNDMRFYIGNTLAATIPAIPNSNVAPCFISVSGTPATQTEMPIGYFGWDVELGGYISDDDFLEV